MEKVIESRKGLVERVKELESSVRQGEVESREVREVCKALL